MADVFLSYAKDDRAQAKLVHELLNAAGWSVFWDEHIKTGADWRQTLDAELTRARVVVVLWSRSSVVSDWVKDEADLARQRDLLVAVLIDRVAPPLGFGHLQAINLIHWQGGRTEGVDKLIDAVALKVASPPKKDMKVPRRPPPVRTILVGGLLLLLLAAYPLTKWLWPLAPLMNQEIVIDASQGMDSIFYQNKPKLSAVIDALRARNLPPDDNLALRTFGGDCNQNSGSTLLVPFGTNRRDRIIRAAGEIKAHGVPTMASGVISALSDLRGLQHSMRIVVLTGHADQCFADAARDIKKRFDDYRQEGHQQLELEVRLIGLNVSAEDRGRLQDISAALGARTYFVNDSAQLNDALDYVLEFEPAISQVNDVSTLMDTISDAMSLAAEYMNRQDYDSAQGVLDAAGKVHRKLEGRFAALANRQSSVTFRQFYQLAVQNRALQQQSFSLGREIVRRGKTAREPTPEYNASVDNWNKAVYQYNSNIGEMNRLAQEMADDARNSIAKDSIGP